MLYGLVHCVLPILSRLDIIPVKPYPHTRSPQFLGKMVNNLAIFADVRTEGVSLNHSYRFSFWFPRPCCRPLNASLCRCEPG